MDTLHPNDALRRMSDDQLGLRLLFEAYELLPSHARGEKAALTEQITLELRVHAQVAHELFYPALERFFDEAGADCAPIEQSQIELALALDLLAQIDDLESDSASLDASVWILAELLAQHAGREQAVLFATARRAGADLESLGRRMARRSADLMKHHAARLGRGDFEDENADPVGRAVEMSLH